MRDSYTKYRNDEVPYEELIFIMHNKPLPHSRWRHNKSTGWDHHTYEVIGIARHSETQEDMVVYRPLYEVAPDNWVYGYDFATRPLSLWYDIVEYGGTQVQRFTQID